jgi:hypothetical protein
MHPTIFFDPAFTTNVLAGFVVTVLGALILLVAGAWWSWSSDSSQQSPQSGAWRALCVLGWAVFIAGWIWQIAGYINTGTIAWTS